MADNNGIKFIKYYLQKLKAFFFSKDILSFLHFFVLATAFWYINALGKERETQITIPLKYIGVPSNVAIDNDSQKAISLVVKDQGLRMFSYNEDFVKPLIIDLNRKFDKKGVIVIPSEQLKSKILRNLLSTTSIIEIKPDSILIKYEQLSTKILPIELVSSIEMADQYMFSNRIKVEPNRIKVYGPESVLNKMKSIRTDLVKLSELNDTLVTTARLKPVDNVKYSTSEVQLSIYVEQFTEKNIQIPISIINCPRNLSIRTFPAIVNATLTVGLSSFEHINSEDVKVYLDYNDLKVSKSSKQKLNTKINNVHVSSLRIAPHEVEFILEHK